MICVQSLFVVIHLIFAMSIEQTSQLISLILNSVLMTVLAAALLGGLWLRQNSLYLQLQQVQKQYRRLTHQSDGLEAEAMQYADGMALPSQSSAQLKINLKKANLKKVRDRRQKLIGQYHWSYTSMLILHAVLLTFGVSLLALSLRSLFLIDGLISTALVLFALGVIGLVAGISCLLVDLSQGNGGSDSLSYSLAKILSAVAQKIRHWQRSSGRLAGSPTALSLKPLSVANSTRSKELPSARSSSDSLIH